MADPIVGTFVHWYAKGFTSNPPLPGLVLEVHTGGMLTLATCGVDARWEQRRCVWPVGAPALSESPKIGIQNGCWAAIPVQVSMAPIPSGVGRGKAKEPSAD